MKQIRLATPNIKPNYFDIARHPVYNWNPDGKQLHVSFTVGFLNDDGQFQQNGQKTFAIANVPEHLDQLTGEMLPGDPKYDKFDKMIHGVDLTTINLTDMLLSYFAPLLGGVVEEV